ncbi:MAG: type II toxin-antitoxin system VapC family toxin [Planctomycetota bacterium]
MIVLDASVAVKWFLDERGSAQARDLRNQYRDGSVELAAPDLLVYEVTNALVCQRVYDPEAVDSAVETLLSLDLILSQPQLDLMSRAAAIAREVNGAVYDAAYVALAEMMEGVLATADRRQAAIAAEWVEVKLIG